MAAEFSKRVLGPVSMSHSPSRREAMTPPGWPLASNTTTGMPNFRRYQAVASPVMPPPMTATGRPENAGGRLGSATRGVEGCGLATEFTLPSIHRDPGHGPAHLAERYAHFVLRRKSQGSVSGGNPKICVVSGKMR